ncbi:MAG: hypothetical protein ABWZ15_07155 [Acidimicrobiia bacterium]
MFDAYCPDHGARVLLPARHILAMEARPGCVVIRMRCWCGAVARAELSGRTNPVAA